MCQGLDPTTRFMGKPIRYIANDNLPLSAILEYFEIIHPERLHKENIRTPNPSLRIERDEEIELRPIRNGYEQFECDPKFAITKPDGQQAFWLERKDKRVVRRVYSKYNCSKIGREVGLWLKKHWQWWTPILITILIAVVGFLVGK